MDSSLFLTTIATAIGLVTLLSVFLTTVAAAAIGLLTLLKKLRFHQDNEENVPSSLPWSSLSPVSDPPPYSSRIWTHHVFPSFRGEDVRRNFLSHVQTEFQRKGITLFSDNGIKRGESIAPELISAIRGSKIAVIMVSRNYASSKWCLDELVEIMKCREEVGQTVLAVFYEVNPSDVKKLAGDFGRVFRKTCAGKTKENIERWKQALEKVATVAGYHSINWDTEAAMIKRIVTDVSNMLNTLTPSNDFDGLIGMGAHLKKMEPLLCLGSDEVRMIGIWGPPGIGKTTIARVAYNQLSDSFQLSVFMDDLKANYTGLSSDDYSAKLQLHQQFMSRIMDHKDMVVSHLGVAPNRLKDKKVLVVLDGVDRLLQLDAIAKETWWFGPGSRIIITTQDQRLFRAHGVNHIYKVNFPRSDEALQIFCTYCFGQKSPKDGFEELAREVTKLAGKLPLGLRVMGCYFRGLSKQEWTNTLPRLKTSLDSDIRSILKFSYDALDDEDKDLFLYIACFFTFEMIHRVEEHLAKNFLEVRQRVKVLAEKSLICIHHGIIRMHSLLRKLGREIVCKQSIHEPGQRQFLYDKREICELLTGDSTGTKSVLLIKLAHYKIEEELDIGEKDFEGMSNLQFLEVYGHNNALQLSGYLNYLPHKLRLLRWSYFPMTCFPCDVNLEFLVELVMAHSKLEKLWEGIKSLQSLKFMGLSYSVNLKELPDFSTATNLEKLNLRGCSSLIRLPSLLGNSLKELDISDCSSLLEFPSFIGNAINLWKLDLSGCLNLVELPDLSTATNLVELNLQNCSRLIKLPSLPRNCLKKLNISDCSSLLEFSSFIGNAVNLWELNLSKCSSLVEFPSFIGNAVNLWKLDLRDCLNLVELPDLSTATNLAELNLQNCSRLIKLPSMPGNSLKELDINDCSSLLEFPSFIGNIVNLWKLDLSGCLNLVELPNLSTATNLVELDLCDCSSLVKLPSLPGNSLKELDISDCSSLLEFPSFIGNAVNLWKLDLSGCLNLVEFPNLSTATNLVELNLQNCSSLVKLPSLPGNSLKELDISDCSSLLEFPSFIGNAVNLWKLDLSGCLNLVELPDLSTATNLDRLDLCDCSSLVKLPSLPGNSLKKLDISGCSSLIKLPSLPGNRLEVLNICACSSPVEFLLFIGNAVNLRKLDFSSSPNMLELPSYVGNATNLEKLDLSDCLNLVELPLSLGNLQKLQYLILKGCSKLEVLPSNINLESLVELDLAGCSSLALGGFSTIRNDINLQRLNLSSLPQLLEVPSFILDAVNLRNLDLSCCSNLVELPIFIGNLQKLQTLILRGCSKLEVLPTNINLESLNILNLSECSMLTRFPQISTNIGKLDLRGTAIEQVPPSIMSWPRLHWLQMSYFENLKEFPHALERITSLWLTDREIQEVPPCVKKMSRLNYFYLKGCGKLVSLPPISDSISSIDARDCESLEILECSFHNPNVWLKFVNCFKLNQEARDLIIQTSSRYAVLPGGKVPEYFTHRAIGGGPLTIKLTEKPLPKFMRFKACILLLNKSDYEVSFKEISTATVVTYKNHGCCLWPALEEHLYTFRINVDVTSSELLFEFKVESDAVWKIGECGLVQD